MGIHHLLSYNIRIKHVSEVNLYETETNPLPILRQHRNFKGCVDALYRLLGELYISPLQDSFSVRLFTCIYLCMKKKLHTKELIHYLKKPARTAIEDTVLQIAKKVQISTAELVTCVEQGIHPQNTEQLLTQLYETSDATFRTLAQDIQFTHAGYPVLEAISNLYLNKQIAFEKL